MSRRTQGNVVAAALLCAFAGAVVISLGFGPNARLVPLPIAATGLVCVMVQIARQNLRGETDGAHGGPLPSIRGARVALPARPAAPTAGQERAAPRDTARRELTAIGIVALFTGLIVALGPVPAVFVFSAGYLGFSRHYGVWKAVAFAAAFATTMYLLFVIGLELQLYHGVFEPLIERF